MARPATKLGSIDRSKTLPCRTCRGVLRLVRANSGLNKGNPFPLYVCDRDIRHTWDYWSFRARRKDGVVPKTPSR